MIQRCTNPNRRAFHRYGGRGVTVCARWRGSFAAFLEDVGPRPSPDHTLDRIDNDGGYEPSNCRWATKHQQANNTCQSRRFEIAGVSKTMKEWADSAGLSYWTVRYRLDQGWPIDRALSPVSEGYARPLKRADGGAS